MQDKPDPDTHEIDNSATKPHSQIDKDEHIAQLQRKLKSLKDAFIKERETKTALEKELADSKKRIDDLELTLFQKENHNLQLLNELKEKTDKGNGSMKGSTKQSTKESFTGSIGSSIGEMFGMKKGEDEYKKLQKEFNYLRKQFDSVKDKLIKADDEKETIRKELKKELDNLRAKLAISEEDLNKKIRDFENLEKENRSLSQSYSTLKDLYAKVDGDMQYLKSRSDMLEKEKNMYKASDEDKYQSSFIQDLNSLISQLENKMRAFNEKIGVFEEKLRERDDYIAEIESRYQVFPVTLVGIANVPAQIILRIDVEGDYILDIETAGERRVIMPYQVASISPNKETENQFSITYRLKTGKTETETFQTKDLTKLLKSLKKFMEKSRDKIKGPIATGGDSGNKKDKKFFAEIASFFGS